MANYMPTFGIEREGLSIPREEQKDVSLELNFRDEMSGAGKKTGDYFMDESSMNDIFIESRAQSSSKSKYKESAETNVLDKAVMEDSRASQMSIKLGPQNLNFMAEFEGEEEKSQKRQIASQFSPEKKVKKVNESGSRRSPPRERDEDQIINRMENSQEDCVVKSYTTVEKSLPVSQRGAPLQYVSNDRLPIESVSAGPMSKIPAKSKNLLKDQLQNQAKKSKKKPPSFREKAPPNLPSQNSSLGPGVEYSNKGIEQISPFISPIIKPENKFTFENLPQIPQHNRLSPNVPPPQPQNHFFNPNQQEEFKQDHPPLTQERKSARSRRNPFLMKSQDVEMQSIIEAYGIQQESIFCCVIESYTDNPGTRQVKINCGNCIIF